ncbi:PGF-pre-PGF domain-containing protein [Methanolacinia petrolearia]|uniref:PGF-pre-PGF domain-containing protein n=1 Tax=Methanolacinia petrolearia TaxID=54120 RepID=UPI003BA9B291
MTAERNTRIITGIFFLLVLLFAVPVSASTVTIDNSSSIAAALLCVGDSGTLILEPGIYFQNSITLSNSTTIKANTSGGHGAADTIIDAQGSGRIFIADSYSYSLSIESLTLRNGRGGYGGAIHTQSSFSSSFTVTNSMFDSCTAKVRGGAIDLIGGTIKVTNLTLTGCTANSGNAINSSGTGEMHFSRIYNCSSSGKTVNSTGTFNATNNWWGTNNPSSGFNSSNVFVEPWLVLGAIVDPSSITPAGTSTVRANLTWNSAGTDTSGIGHVPDGIPLSFAIARGSGNLSVTNGYLISGINESIFTPDGLGTTNLSATLDDQTVNVSLIVSPVPLASFTGSPTSGTVPLVVSFTDTSTGSPTCWNWSFGDGEWFNTTNPGLKNATHTYLSAGTYTVNLTVSNGLGNYTESLAGYITVNPASSSGGSSSRGSGGGSNSDTGTGFATDIKAGETVSFDLDKGAVYIVSITAGTDIKKLMITVQRKLSVPSSVGNPGTNVYEYENAELYYADNSEVSGGTFNFKVERSWMTAKGYDYTDIVMLHYNEETGEWENLPTTFLSEDGNYYYYSAETPSFSWFAIAVSEDSAAVSGSSESTKAATAVSTSSSSNVPAE